MVRLPVLEEIRPVVFVADESLATHTARGALPAAVPHRDAVANAARSALLVAALTRVPEVLFDATQDYLHQPYRAAVMPRTAELVARLRAAGVAAVVSGAGPSVLALTVAGAPGWPDLVDSITCGNGYRMAYKPPGHRPARRDPPDRRARRTPQRQRAVTRTRTQCSRMTCPWIQFPGHGRPGLRRPGRLARLPWKGRAELPQDWTGSFTTHGPVPGECCGLS